MDDIKSLWKGGMKGLKEIANVKKALESGKKTLNGFVLFYSVLFGVVPADLC